MAMSEIRTTEPWRRGPDERQTGAQPRVCMFVYNNCLSDQRVRKEARTVAQAGYRVTIVAVLDKRSVPVEEDPDFTIVRIDRNPVHYRLLRRTRRMRRRIRVRWARLRLAARRRIARLRRSRRVLARAYHRRTAPVRRRTAPVRRALGRRRIALLRHRPVRLRAAAMLGHPAAAGSPLRGDSLELQSSSSVRRAVLAILGAPVLGYRAARWRLLRRFPMLRRRFYARRAARGRFSLRRARARVRRRLKVDPEGLSPQLRRPLAPDLRGFARWLAPGRAVRAIDRGVSAVAYRSLMAFHRPLMFTDYYRRAFRTVVDEGYAVFHAHDVLTLPVAAWAARRTGARLAYDSHELYSEVSTLSRRERRVWRFVERRLIRRADGIMTVCESIADELVHRYAVPKPVILLNCPPRAAAPLNLVDCGHLRAAAGLRAGEAIILYQGGYTANRGIEELIDAMRHVDYGVLVLMGWGVIEGDLRARIRAAELSERVRMIPPAPPQRLLEFTVGADVGVIPYKAIGLNNYYTTPNKLFEYIAAGVAVAGSRFPELRRVIEGARVGVTFDPDDPHDIGLALNYLLQDRAQARRAPCERTRGGAALRVGDRGAQAARPLLATDGEPCRDSSSCTAALSSDAKFSLSSAAPTGRRGCQRCWKSTVTWPWRRAGHKRLPTLSCSPATTVQSSRACTRRVARRGHRRADPFRDPGTVRAAASGDAAPGSRRRIGPGRAFVRRRGGASVTDATLSAQAQAFGYPGGGRIAPPRANPDERERRVEWSTLDRVPLEADQAAAWREPGYDIERWTIEPDVEVLAEWRAGASGERHPAIIRRGRFVAASFSLFAFLVRSHTAEPWYHGEQRRSPRSTGIEHLLLALVDQMYARAGAVRARLLPWPRGAAWAMNVRHDFDRPLRREAVAEIAARHDALGSAPTWYWRSRHLRTGLRRVSSRAAGREGNTALREVASFQGQEIAHHTEMLWRGAEREQEAIESVSGRRIHGASSHGDPSCFRFQGAPNVLWAEKQRLLYTELIQHGHFHPHRFVTLELDGAVRPLQVICLPHHESFDRSTTPGDTAIDRLRSAPPTWMAVGGMLQVMNHPDLNIDQLFELLGDMPREGRLDWTAEQCAEWWQRTHVIDELELRPDGQGRFRARSRRGVDAVLIEIRRPDGTTTRRTFDFPSDQVTVFSV